GETRTVRFTLAWHFPNRTVNWSQKPFFGFPDDRTTFWLGNRYNTRFGSALDVVAHTGREHDRLASLTRLARDTFYDTTLPFNLIDTVTAQMSVARTPTCFWTEDGNFYGFEGCNGISTWHTEPWGGSCPLNCTHVWNYEMSLARLYPTIERTMRDTEWHIQQHPTGYLPHRVLLPTYLPRHWDKPMGGPLNPALDGLLGAILKSYREFLANGDRAWLDLAWPKMKLALDHLWSAHDPERTGVIEGEQPNTYDISIYGANTFIGTLYLAALRVMEELAKRQGEPELASACRAVFERGRESLEARLWNGEFYVQEVDFAAYPVQNWGIGCHTDQLLGQWWANLLGLGSLLDPERVRSAARAIVRHNFRESFVGFDPPVQIRQLTRHFVIDDDKGLQLCTWPNGGRPAVPTQYCDEVWTGMEYEVAALLFQSGEPELGVTLVEAVRRRHDGRRQSPWNDIECGDHYARAMSSWSLLEAASGYRYDASTGTIGFDPVLQPEAFRAPFVTRDGWGTFSQTIAHGRASLRIEPVFGWLDLRRIAVAGDLASGTTHARLDGEPLAVVIDANGGCSFVRFTDELRISAGGSLAIEIERAAPAA
ncbi:MAG: hypothetical protein IT336_02780, partial [Thermomicrobiales bacterium]|nr:hypothetical protein [Thermomicrobiales bacterium]